MCMSTCLRLLSSKFSDLCTVDFPSNRTHTDKLSYFISINISDTLCIIQFSKQFAVIDKVLFFSLMEISLVSNVLLTFSFLSLSNIRFAHNLHSHNISNFISLLLRMHRFNLARCFSIVLKNRKLSTYLTEYFFDLIKLLSQNKVKYNIILFKQSFH